MCSNSFTSLFSQQYGIAKWNEFDAALYRLQPTPNAVQPVTESPIFACKRAAKPGYEHIVAMATEAGRLVVTNTQSVDPTEWVVNAHNNAIFDLAWQFDQMHLVTASGDHSSKLYDIGNGGAQEIGWFSKHNRSIKTVCFSKHDPSVFATGGRDGNIILWDTRANQNSVIGNVDKIIANAHRWKDVKTPSKQKKKKNNTPVSSIGQHSVTGLAFQNTNSLISCGAGDGFVKVWDLRKHYTISKRCLPKHSLPYAGKTAKNGFSDIMIDESGLRLYASSLDNTIYCYNIGTYNPTPIRTYSGHQTNNFYIKCCLDQDEKYLVSGSSDESAYIWNLKYSQPIVKLTGHTAEVTCAAWCSNKQTPTIITCSDDTTYKKWRIANLDTEACVNGKVEILPLPSVKRPTRKRVRPLDSTIALKKTIWQCRSCKKATMFDSLCENCIPSSSTKRKADSGLYNDCKRVNSDFGPRRLFAHLDQNQSKELVTILEKPEDESMNLKSLTKPLDYFKASSPDDKTLLKSPTMNLPNYVIDGTAPHLNYSPPKRKSQDWLTRMRIEKNLRQDMLDRTMGPSSPKSPKLELTPKSTKSTTPNSSLLSFFKVINNGNSPKCETGSKNQNCMYMNNINRVT